MLEFKVGMDPEFMAKCNGSFIYPILGEEQTGLIGQSDKVKERLQDLDADEFGHCVEIRPKEATSGKQLVLNAIDAISKLPDCFTYHAMNTHLMPKKEFFSMLRKLGRKDLSQSQNIYDKDILDDCPAELEARQNGQRLVFCGAHMHISAQRRINVMEEGKVYQDYENVELPVKTLVRAFDDTLFDWFEDDKDFNIGRYRSKGFYERKAHGGFEYRSLGSTVMTPKRIMLIADTMLNVTRHIMSHLDEYMFNGDNIVSSFIRNGIMPNDAMEHTKPYNGHDLRRIWLPFVEWQHADTEWGFESVLESLGVDPLTGTEPEEERESGKESPDPPSKKTPIKKTPNWSPGAHSQYKDKEIIAAMKKHGGVISRAANELGCSWTAVGNRMKKFDREGRTFKFVKPVGSSPRNQIWTDDDIIDAMKKHRGIVQRAADELGCGWNTVANRMSKLGLR